MIGVERGRGIPKADVERLMSHYNIDRATAEYCLSICPIEELLLERGTGLETGRARGASNNDFFTVAEAGSFEELKEVMPRLTIPKGARVRFVIELNAPVAPAFDLAGAELIFGTVMPEGLELIDVYGEGWTTAVLEAEADPVWLPAVGAFLLLHWKALALITIGIMAALGFLILSIRVDVTEALKAAPEIAKWVAVGIGGIALIGLISVLAKGKG